MGEFSTIMQTRDTGYANTENVFYCLNSTFLCHFLLRNYNVKLSSYTFYGGNVVCAYKNICSLGSCSIF